MILFNVYGYSDELLGQVEASDIIEAWEGAGKMYMGVLDVRPAMERQVLVPPLRFATKEMLKVYSIHDITAVGMGLSKQSIKVIERGWVQNWRFLLIARNPDLVAVDWDQDKYGETFESYSLAIVKIGKEQGKPKFAEVCRTELWEWLPEQNGYKLIRAIPIPPYSEEEVIAYEG